MNEQKKTLKDWFSIPLKDLLLPIAIAFVGYVGSCKIADSQIESAEKIALKEQQVKLYEIFSTKLDIDYTKEVWGSEGSVRLLGAILKSEENPTLKKFARAVFEESIITAIGQFHRTEKIGISAARFIASMYHICPEFVIKKLVAEIKPEDYPGTYYIINGSIVVTLNKIPDYWEGTMDQFEKVKNLENHKFLGPKSQTIHYRDDEEGWLKKALRKYKPRKEEK